MRRIGAAEEAEEYVLCDVREMPGGGGVFC